MRDNTIKTILDRKIIAIVRGLEPDLIIPLADALYSGGIRLMELTFDQSDPDSWKDTCDGIRSIAKLYEGKIYVGAGTVLSKHQVDIATEAGARYIISPDARPEIIEHTRKADAVSIPGCMTPTEITCAVNAGADIVKVFPAGILGTGYIRAIMAPLKHVKLFAVGGITAENVSGFIQAGCAGAGVGGSLVNMEMIRNGRTGQITETAKEFVRLVNI